MPINPSALSSSASERSEDPDDAPEVKEQIQAEAPKRTRRKKAELIADAVVPGMDDVVEIKDAGTGAKIERPWRVAVEMVRDEKAQWANSDQKYAFLKYEQQRAASAFQTSDGPASQEPMGAADTGEPYAQTSSPETHDASGQRKAPEGAEVGDEVLVGTETFVVGHGHVLVKGVVEVDGEVVRPARRWRREIGDPDGPFVAEKLAQPSVEQRASELEASNGRGSDENVRVETERLPRQMEQVSGGDDGVLKWKIGNGILEKIGLPDYSSLQVGPITASRMVIDDGRRTVVPLNDGRTGEVPTAVIEAFEEIDNVVEYIASRFRGQLQAFLQATGALKQPVG